MYDAIVVGSGPAGVFASFGLQGKSVLLLDVGKVPPGEPSLSGNLLDQRLNTDDLFGPLIGEKFESLHNLHSPEKMSLKLKAPYLRFVLEDWQRLSPMRSTGFDAVMSFAKGGLANAWGAGAYRFNEDELRDYPLSQKELDPFYDELTEHVGISGESDDLDPYFGPGTGLQDPLQINGFFSEFLQRYRARRDFFRQRGISIGRARLAVLSRAHRGRDAYNYESNEFFKPRAPAIYNPAFTLEELISSKRVTYVANSLVTSFEQLSDRVKVTVRNLKSETTETFYSKTLFLAAGALNSSRLVLQSLGDFSRKLPLLDNPMSCVPIFRLTRIGDAMTPADSALAQLNLVYQKDGITLQASLYGTTGPLTSDVLFELPFALSTNLAWSKYLRPAMGVVMLFHPADTSNKNWLRLNSDGTLEVSYHDTDRKKYLSTLVRSFRKIGFYCSMSLAQYPKPGSSLHFAGSLPMKDKPGPYQTDRFGKLYGTQGVYCVDGASLSGLPAKNHTLTIMANSLRISRHVREMVL